jgi:hypothetical protein
MSRKTSYYSVVSGGHVATVQDHVPHQCDDIIVINGERCKVYSVHDPEISLKTGGDAWHCEAHWKVYVQRCM